MEFVPFSGVGQFNIRGSFQSNKVENVLHFANDAEAIDPTNLVAAATTLLESWGDNMIPVLSSAYSLREVYAVDLTTETSETATAALTTPLTGALGGAAAPGNAALVITHRTTQRGRSFRGRTYIVGLSGGSVNGNVIDGTAAGNILTGFQQVIADMNAISWTFVIASRIHEGVPRVTGLATVVATSLLRDFNLDSQRRRLNERGQ